MMMMTMSREGLHGTLHSMHELLKGMRKFTTWHQHGTGKTLHVSRIPVGQTK